ncbi:type II toxin-antitoxin system VapC family toxin [Nocardioides sp. DS6]|uniref:Ribonuclease VapC n=1 Tax=Nocardioides eburneus TaxID=3231482 RepID=A0ABV3T365_9ACTN
MKLVDANVLVYTANEDSPFHDVAKRWLDGALSGGSPVGFAWLALVGFVRIATLPVWPQPLTATEAMDQVDAWLGARSARILQPGHNHPTLMRRFVDEIGTGGNLINDAHLAALALEHKATIVSFDGDFRRFPGVRWERPR